MSADEKLFGRLPILSEPEVQSILDGALDTLGTTGVRFEDREARDILVAAGATVVGEDVRLPKDLVLSALSESPSLIVLPARDPAHSIELGQRRFVTTNGFGTAYVLDGRSGARREAVAEDMARLTRLSDRLSEVGFCQHLVSPSDLAQDVLDVALPCIALANTSKHCHLSSYSSAYADQVFDLGEIVAEGCATEVPPYSLGCCSLSPLRFPKEATALLRKAVQRGIPFLVVCGAVAGVTSPVTLAGSLVVQTAELLAASTLAQTVRPGAAIAWGSFTSPMDPRTTRQSLGGAELSLVNGATAQICRYVGVPFGYGTGGVSDASSVGIQAGIEKALTTLSAALAGVEVIHDAASGIIDSGLTVSYEQLVIDDEMCRVVRRFLRGIDVDESTLALDVIAAAGPGGSYPALPHTALHFRKELHLTDFWVKGQEEEDADVVKRAAVRAETLAASPPRQPLSEDQVRAMLKIWTSVGLPEDVGRGLLPSA